MSERETTAQQFLRVQLLAEEQGPTLPLLSMDKAAIKTVLRVALAVSREIADASGADIADVIESAAGGE